MENDKIKIKFYHEDEFGNITFIKKVICINDNETQLDQLIDNFQSFLIDAGFHSENINKYFNLNI